MKSKNRPKKIVLGAASVVLFKTICLPSVLAGKTSLEQETLCRQFPSSSRCHSSSAQLSTTQLNLEAKIDRQNFCQRFPLNSRCQEPESKIFEVNLDRSGEKDEWIRIEQQDRSLKLTHTTKVKNGFVSEILNGGLDLIPLPIPLPLPKLNHHSWKDHNTVRVTFMSDRCKSKKCLISGTDTLVLPQGDDVYGGEFTIDYREEGMARSVSFRVSDSIEAKTEETITVRFSN